MASGDSVIESFRVVQPNTVYATQDVRLGGSTPAEAVPVYDFDAATAEYLDIYCRLGPNYGGGGLTIRLPWAASTATTNNVVWRAAIRRVADDAEDVDVSQTYDFNSVTDTAPSASGEFTDAVITFTSGADMDSLAAGELFILRVGRDAGNGSDNMAGDAELWADAIVIRET